MAGTKNDTLVGKNADFSQAGAPNATTSENNGLVINGDLWIGSTALNAGGTHINVGNITSPLGTLTIGYATPDITIDLSGSGLGIDSIGVQTGTSPVVPTPAGLVTFNGATVAAGTNPVRTNGTAANTMALEVQISQALAATDATKIGLANFDSAAFDVDANGFVQLNGGGIATTSFDVQANTAPGTDPVVPTAAGVVTVNGAVVANHSVVLESHSRAANAYNLEVQYATSAAATDGTKSGVAHFDSTSFSVDASGFVQSVGGGFTWNDVSGAFSPLKNNGYFITGTATGTLPAGPAQGDTIKFFVDHASQVLTIDAPGTQIIRMGSAVTAAGGTAVSTAQGDSVELVYRASDTCWCAIAGFSGIWVLT